MVFDWVFVFLMTNPRFLLRSSSCSGTVSCTKGSYRLWPRSTEWWGGKPCCWGAALGRGTDVFCIILDKCLCIWWNMENFPDYFLNKEIGICCLFRDAYSRNLFILIVDQRKCHLWALQFSHLTSRCNICI